MEALRKKVENLRADVESAAGRLKLAEIETELKNLRGQMAKPDFWQDAQKAQEMSKREADIARHILPWRDLQRSADELFELVKIGDAKMDNELQDQLSALSSQFSTLKRDLRFSGPYDDHDAIVSIYAGAGGTDAQDWAQMLLRMYIRWAEKKGFKVVTIDQSAGEEAGIKSATIKITGNDFLYGKLAGEHGVHRLVRLSPFNADHLRQTSFAKVEGLPLIERS